MINRPQDREGTIMQERRGQHRRILLLVALLSLSFLVVAGATPVPQTEGPGTPDPSKPGPYATGVTQRTLVRVSNRNGEPRTLETTIWYPARLPAMPTYAPPDRSGAPYPVVVYSHGTNGNPRGSRFFTEQLASHGFIVIAPAHPGNTEMDCPRPCVRSNPTWLEALQETMANRPDDIGFVFDQVVALSGTDDPQLAGMVDANRAGLAGWSLGGWTTLTELARAPRFIAGVTFAPSGASEYTVNTAAVHQPTMIVVGRQDNLFGRAQQYFAELPSRAEQRLVIIQRAGHVVFGDICDSDTPSDCPPDRLAQDEAHTRIDHWATAFLLTYVAGDRRYEPFLDPSSSANDPELEIRTRQ